MHAGVELAFERRFIMTIEMNVHNFCENARMKSGFVFWRALLYPLRLTSPRAGTLLRCTLRPL